MQAHIDKINEMATVMRKAIEVDEGRICEDEEKIKQLEVKCINYFMIMKISFSHVVPTISKFAGGSQCLMKNVVVTFNNNPNNNKKKNVTRSRVRRERSCH